MRSRLELKGPSGVSQGCLQTHGCRSAPWVLSLCLCTGRVCYVEKRVKENTDGCLQWPPDTVFVGTRQWEEVCSFSGGFREEIF